MLRAARKKIERQAKQAGNPYFPPTEVLPTGLNDIRAWVTKLFYTRPAWDLMALESAVPPEFRGKSIDEVVNDVLNPLRINVAHGLPTVRPAHGDVSHDRYRPDPNRWD